MSLLNMVRLNRRLILEQWYPTSREKREGMNWTPRRQG
jgi:hypothetical protein